MSAIWFDFFLVQTCQLSTNINSKLCNCWLCVCIRTNQCVFVFCCLFVCVFLCESVRLLLYSHVQSCQLSKSSYITVKTLQWPIIRTKQQTISMRSSKIKRLLASILLVEILNVLTEIILIIPRHMNQVLKELK